MKTISIANLKGGVGKTITTINLRYLLASEFGMRVLVVDNDQQGNTSQFFGRYDYEHPGMSEVMLRKCDDGYTEKVDESTFSSEPIMVHSKYCGAAKDYRGWAQEVLEKIAEGRKAE